MIWQDVETPVFCAWWPSQFRIADPNVHVLARYEDPQTDACSSDISVADGGIVGWPELEQRYGILLDPARLRGEPAAVEGWFGRGRVILSLVHFDTPGDRDGAVVLKNLWTYLSSNDSVFPETGPRSTAGRPDPGLSKVEASSGPNLPQEVLELVGEIQAIVVDLIDTGERNFLWYWRNPLLLHWRRGVRGLEYSTLAMMVAEIGKCLDHDRFGNDVRPGFPESIDATRLHPDLMQIRMQIAPFVAKAKRLLVRERFYMQRAPLSPLVCDDGEIRRLRQELFGSAMSHGGDFKLLIDVVDRLLYELIKRI